MPQFRKKPVVVNAAQVGSEDFFSAMPEWLEDAYDVAPVDVREPVVGSVWNVRLKDGSDIIRVATLEGVVDARQGDWIIQGVKGEIYPCKPDIFEATYEVA